MEKRKSNNCITYSPNGYGRWYIGHWHGRCSPREYIDYCRRVGLDSGFHRMTDIELAKHGDIVKGWFPGEYQIIEEGE